MSFSNETYTFRQHSSFILFNWPFTTLLFIKFLVILFSKMKRNRDICMKGCQGGGQCLNSKKSSSSSTPYSEYYSKIKGVTVPLGLYLLPFFVSVYSLCIYFEHVANREWNRLVYIAFMITAVNSFVGFPWFGKYKILIYFCCFDKQSVKMIFAAKVFEVLKF